MSLGYFVAAVRCPVCATTSKADTSTRMESHLGNEPGEVFGVGDNPDVGVGSMVQSFLTARRPTDNHISILQQWHCPTCRSANWAEVRFDNGVIASIENVRLTKAVLDRANFIDEDIYETYAELTGESMYENNELRPSYLDTLRSHLPDA